MRTPTCDNHREHKVTRRRSHRVSSVRLSVLCGSCIYVCLANGSISFVCTRRVPVVSLVAAAISDVGLDAADHPLDCEHHPHIRPVALARAWASVGSTSCLGNAAGIRMRGDSCCNYRFAPDQPTGHHSAQRTGTMKPTALLTICESWSVCPSSSTWLIPGYRPIPLSNTLVSSSMA